MLRDLQESMFVQKLVADLLLVDVDQIAKVLLVKGTHVGKEVGDGFDDHVRPGLDRLLAVGAKKWHDDVVVGGLRDLVVREYLRERL